MRIGAAVTSKEVEIGCRCSGAAPTASGAETPVGVDKFAGSSWREGPQGVPLHVGCAHRFIGRRVTLLDAAGPGVRRIGAD